jgi:DNA-binding response OmpR family regulator
VKQNSRPKILVAEDSLAIAALIRVNLERNEFSVRHAPNGREAWECAQREHFDLVVTDEQMPIMSGQELCRLLRNDERYSQTPIVFITAKRFELEARHLKNDLRVSAVFGKPFSIEHLVATVSSEISTSTTAA